MPPFEESQSTPQQNRSLLLIFLGPVLVLASTILLFTALAEVLGWYPRELLLTTMVAGMLVVASTAVLIRYEYIARRAMRRAEVQVSTVLESAMDAVVTVDEEQRVLLFNQAAEKVFQWPREKVLGQPLEMLLPSRLRQLHRSHVVQFGATGSTSRRMGEHSVLVGLRADGEEFPVEASISKSGGPGKQIYTAILRDVSQRVRAEQALRSSREELREMATLSQNVREQEKSRVARELHDELGGALTALKMDAAWLHERLPQGSAELEDKLVSMQRLLDQTVAATRRISADLRPMMLDDLGLAPAVDWLVQDFQRRSGIACELAVGSPDLQASGLHATAIFRILQESLTNVARHAAATQVEITLNIEGQSLILTVRDNGRGFSADGSRASDSFGLIGMRERVYLLNGSVNIQSESGKGTVVEVSIPLEQQESGA